MFRILLASNHQLDWEHVCQKQVSRAETSNYIPQMASHYIDGFVQDCSNSIADALELLQSCTKPSISTNTFTDVYWCILTSLALDGLINLICLRSPVTSFDPWSLYLMFSRWRGRFQVYDAKVKMLIRLFWHVWYYMPSWLPKNNHVFLFYFVYCHLIW